MVKLSKRQEKKLAELASPLFSDGMNCWTPSDVDKSTGIYRTIGVLVEKGMVTVEQNPEAPNDSTRTIRRITEAGRDYVKAHNL